VGGTSHFSTLRLPAKAAKTKLALRAQTVVFAGAKAAGAGRPEKSPMRASGIRFPSYAGLGLKLDPEKFSNPGFRDTLSGEQNFFL